MLPNYFVIIGALIGIFGGMAYAVDTIKGKVKPNRVSFFFWALAPLIAFAAQLSEGVGIQSLLTFSVGFIPLFILIASFINKQSEWKLTRFDLTCGFFSFIGILFWYITKSGDIAILFGILADGFAAIPTIIKSYHYPETENGWPYLTGAINSGLTLLTIDVWNFNTFGFPLYILVLTLAIYALVQFKLGKIIRANLQQAK